MTMNAPAPLSGTMDVDEFMAFYRTRPKGERWDLIEGAAMMMSPVSYLHRRVSSNLRDLLNSAFRAEGLDWDFYAFGKVAVRSPGLRNFQPEPEVVVTSDTVDYDSYYSECFQLVAEVLTPLNTRTLIDLKTRRYCEAPSNCYAVVIDAGKYMVEIYAKSRKWEPAVLQRPDDVIEMPEFGLRCVVADLYAGMPLDPRRVG